MASMQAIRVSRSESLKKEESPKLSSPEAKLGMQVDELWDVQEPQLSPTEKLNACFESIPVSSFPVDPSAQVIEIKSNTSLAEAVQILAEHRILSAPIVDVNAPEDASWMDRYIGIVEFAGIVVWILQQSEPPSPKSPATGAFRAIVANGLTNATGLGTLGPEDATTTSGDFFQALTSSEFYKRTTVRDISGTFRWAPFLALQKSNSFLTMLLLLSKYKMKSVPVVDLGDNKIDHIVTQASIIHMLAECIETHWFESWGNKTLSTVGLPLISTDCVVKVYEDEPVLQAFKLMRKTRVGGVPVLAKGSNKALGNISLRDVHFLLTAPDIYQNYRSITATNFLTAVKDHLNKHHGASPMLNGMITCRKNDTMKDLIMTLDTKKIHRIYVVDDNGNLEGVITLRDIISRLVHEPRGYFGDFFDGVLPLPSGSRV